ncbi:glutathione S-transferase family protein [Loktanella sp. S4079]|uniref:glutathione S-transferase family protein n=1 Tax=Loktanella sp. S4079 TaxID=579483 RepID=UPI0005FA65DC|nr:glutathione S-transferase family protein [Loktanella sp. S4079]KJZ20548.1 hypothetical protein TW80_07140 [Loktanella sp. S4079]
MENKLRLHYAPDNASLCVRLTLEELGLPYETTLVDRSTSAHKSPAYLALNPNGLIPVLETPSGPMFETAAILLWLADRKGQMIPAIDAAERVQSIQWLFWISNTFHTSLRMLFYPDKYTNADVEDFRAVTRNRLIDQLTMLDQASTVSWRDSDEASIHACYLAPLLRWCALYGGNTEWFDLKQYPNLLSFARRFEQRPAMLRAAKSEGLGPTPISAPSPCCPPEGVAL